MKRFTLIELLVAIAIIGILVSLLAPSLKNARERGRQASCLSNTKSWGTAAMMYHDDNQKFWNALGWPYRTSGKSAGGVQVTGRPANQYLGYNTDGMEVTAAKCPSDTYWVVNDTLSAYDKLGTSYCDNMSGSTIRRRGGNGSKSLGEINVTNVVNPSNCLLFMEWPIVSQTYRPDEEFPSWHGKQQFFNVTTVDGSAKFTQILVGQLYSDKFNFEYDH